MILIVPLQATEYLVPTRPLCFQVISSHGINSVECASLVFHEGRFPLYAAGIILRMRPTNERRRYNV